MSARGWVALAVIVGVGAVAWLLQRTGPPRGAAVRVVALDGFATPLGRVAVRPPDARARFHRHAHEAWLALDDAGATFSRGGGWTRARVSAGQLLYTPPYALHACTGRALVFIAAPEDDPVYVDDGDARLRDSADAAVLSGDGRWMLDKLERRTVTATQTVGPFAREAAIYVVSGRGELRGDTVHAVAAGQLAVVSPGAPVEIAGTLTVLVFDPARTTVSPILKEGEKRYSQDDEELIIRDFFHDRRGGVFVDVGAGDYRRFSTTFYLEEQLGWSGVAIDALSDWAEGYHQHRKRTTFVNALITDRARGSQTFYRADDFPEASSVSKPLAVEQARELSDSGAVSERVVPSSTLDAVLDAQHVAAIDFLSMDIEEHEPAALAGFDIDRFHPELVCIEAHEPVRDALWQYFRRHGYRRQDQYLAWDSANWYFARR